MKSKIKGKGEDGGWKVVSKVTGTSARVGVGLGGKIRCGVRGYKNPLR